MVLKVLLARMIHVRPHTVNLLGTRSLANPPPYAVYPLIFNSPPTHPPAISPIHFQLVTLLGLNVAPKDGANGKPPCVVFHGPHEHHSNILPWREAPGCEVVSVPEDVNGGVDRVALQRLLQQYQDRPLRIGSFSAASNVTGVLADVDGITQQLHKAVR